MKHLQNQKKEEGQKMKWEFNLTLSGNQNFDKKFEDYTTQKTHLHGDFITAMALLVKVTMGIDSNDQMGIDNFKAGRIIEDMPITPLNLPKTNATLENTETPKENEVPCNFCGTPKEGFPEETCQRTPICTNDPPEDKLEVNSETDCCKKNIV